MQRDAELFEMVRFLKDNAITRADLRMELNVLRSELMTHIDGLFHLYQKVDQEVTVLHHRVGRLEESAP